MIDKLMNSEVSVSARHLPFFPFFRLIEFVVYFVGGELFSGGRLFKNTTIK